MMGEQHKTKPKPTFVTRVDFFIVSGQTNADGLFTVYEYPHPVRPDNLHRIPGVSRDLWPGCSQNFRWNSIPITWLQPKTRFNQEVSLHSQTDNQDNHRNYIHSVAWCVDLSAPPLILKLNLHTCWFMCWSCKIADFLLICGEKTPKFSFNNPIQFIGEELTATWKS